MSHYQVEGGDVCDWSEWSPKGGPCGDAAGSWQRYESDAVLARLAGANAFRFSISWSRVEPRRGHFDLNALERYSRFVDALVALKIEPVVTLFHYTHPTWFHEKTPWTSTASAMAFGRFAGRVADALGDRVKFWIPLNEPLVFILAGYLEGQIPPGVSDPAALNRVFDHMLAAHCAAAGEIRTRIPGAAIGVAHNMMDFAPDRESNPLDALLARTAHAMYNRGIIEAFSTGRWNFFLPPGTTIRGRRDELPAYLDTFGINFYSRLHLRCPGRRRWIGDFDYHDRSGHGLTDNGWEIAPDSLGRLIDEAAQSGFPLVITENGIADATDRFRPEFLRMHAREIARAEERGIPIHGYFHWSLLDNYEWLEGFEPRFGLYAVDPETLSRTPRPSVEVFKSLGAEFLHRRVESSLHAAQT